MALSLLFFRGGGVGAVYVDAPFDRYVWAPPLVLASVVAPVDSGSVVEGDSVYSETADADAESDAGDDFAGSTIPPFDSGSTA